MHPEHKYTLPGAMANFPFPWRMTRPSKVTAGIILCSNITMSDGSRPKYLFSLKNLSVGASVNSLVIMYLKMSNRMKRYISQSLKEIFTISLVTCNYTDHGTVHFEPCFASAIIWIFWMRSACIWYRVLPLGSPMLYIPLGYWTPRRVPWPPARSRTPTRFLEICKSPAKTVTWATCATCKQFEINALYIKGLKVTFNLYQILASLGLFNLVTLYHFIYIFFLINYMSSITLQRNICVLV